MPEFDRDETLRLAEPLEQMRLLVRAMGQSRQSLHADQVVRTTLEEVERVLGGSACFVLVNQQTRTVTLEPGKDLPPPLFQELERLASDPQLFASLDETREPASWLAKLGDRLREILERQSVQAPLSIALHARTAPVGFLLIVPRETPISLTPDWIEFVGEQVGGAIEHARLHQALRESEEWHRHFIENSLDACVQVGADGRIAFANSAACRILGYAPGELLGLRGLDFLANPPESQPAAETLSRTGIMSDHLVRARTKSGEFKTLSVTTRAVRDRHGRLSGYQSVARDVTEQQKWLAMLNRRNHELNTLNAIADILNHPLKLAPALDQVCSQIASITGMEGVAIFLIDESTRVLRLLAHCGLTTDVLGRDNTLALDDPAIYHIAVEGESIALDDVSLYPSPATAESKLAGFLGGIGVPITQHGRPVGALFAGSRGGVHYDPSDVALLLNIGQRIGMALENADLYKHMQRRMFELDGLGQLSAACASSLDPRAISQLAVESTRKLLHVDVSSLHRMSGGALTLDACTASPEPIDQAALHLAELALLERHGVWAIDDIAADPAARPALAACFETTPLRSALIVPLLSRDRRLGLLLAGYSTPHAWTQPEIDLLQTIANQIASALTNAQLFQDVMSEQRKVQAIFDSGLSGLFATDAAGRIEMFNRAAERITGWSLQEVIGKKWEEVFADPKRGESVEPLIDVALKNKQTAYVPDGRRILTADGRIIPVAKAVAPLVAENGVVTGAVGAFWDLSREKAGELSREKFLQMAAHQMRNPLTALIVALDLVDDPRLTKKRREETRALIKSQAERLRKWSQEFLVLEEPEHLARPVRCAPLPIASLLRRLVQESRATHRDHQFDLRLCEPEPLAYADADRVENILQNLIDNAVYYSPIKTTVTLSLAVRPAENQVDIAVQDQGPGIPLKEQEHVFEMFFRAQDTLERRVYGHGLGLYLARKFAQEMDGTIELNSGEGKGCTFHLILRRCQ